MWKKRGVRMCVEVDTRVASQLVRPAETLFASWVSTGKGLFACVGANVAGLVGRCCTGRGRGARRRSSKVFAESAPQPTLVKPSGAYLVLQTTERSSAPGIGALVRPGLGLISPPTTTRGRWWWRRGGCRLGLRCAARGRRRGRWHDCGKAQRVALAPDHQLARAVYRGRGQWDLGE